MKRPWETRRRDSAVLSALVVLLVTFLSGAAMAGERVDPQALGYLQRMCDYLGSLPAFTVLVHNESEVILVDGQKLDFSVVAQVTLKRPNSMRAHRVDVLDEADLYYDGKAVTLHYKKPNLYATAPVGASLDTALDVLRDSLAIDIPGADLLYSDSCKGMTWDLTDAMYVGLESLGELAVHHLAFRTTSVDFQVWVDDGERPLPRKYVITTKWMTGAPQNGVVLTNWDVSPRIDPAVFSFTPPPGAMKIDFLKAGAMMIPE